MGGEKIPIIVLGGSDRKSAELPESGRDKHPLSGCKGVDIRIGKRPMVAATVERVLAAGCFGPIYVAGPAKVYQGVPLSAELIDTDGSFGRNIEVSLEAVREAHPGRPIGFLTCDVLPEVLTLREVVAEFERCMPCDLFFPLIRAPQSLAELGAFAWKPVYRIVPEPGAPPVRILPCHLVLIDPEALRRQFLYRLFDVGYATRNRSVDTRRSAIVRKMISELLYQDLRHVLGLRLPTLTWTVLSAGLPAGAALRDGTITRRELEDAMRRIFVRSEHLRRYPDRRILTPLIDGISLALDVDTEEEAREIGGESHVASF